MTASAILIAVDGTTSEVRFTTESEFPTIKYALDGATIQAIYSASGETTFWMDDEGKLKGLPVNRKATELLWELNPAFRGRDILCGPVLVTGGADDEGYTVSITTEALNALH